MSLIGSAYFINDISVPALGGSIMEDYIKKYEPEILDKVLGYELRKLVDDDATSPTRILGLVSGKDYTVSYNGRDQVVRWEGLRDSTTLISLIAYYVYYWVHRNNITTTTQNGEVLTAIENANIGSPNAKIGNAWYKMRQLVGYNGQHQLEPSLYNFLTKYTDTYPEWVFNDIGKVNMYGI